MAVQSRLDFIDGFSRAPIRAIVGFGQDPVNFIKIFSFDKSLYARRADHPRLQDAHPPGGETVLNDRRARTEHHERAPKMIVAMSASKSSRADFISRSRAKLSST